MVVLSDVTVYDTVNNVHRRSIMLMYALDDVRRSSISISKCTLTMFVLIPQVMNLSNINGSTASKVVDMQFTPTSVVLIPQRCCGSISHSWVFQNFESLRFWSAFRDPCFIGIDQYKFHRKLQQGLYVFVEFFRFFFTMTSLFHSAVKQCTHILVIYYRLLMVFDGC